jgi:hypothetical protein
VKSGSGVKASACAARAGAEGERGILLIALRIPCTSTLGVPISMELEAEEGLEALRLPLLLRDPSTYL